MRKRLARRKDAARKRNASNAKRLRDSTRKWKGNGNVGIDEQPGVYLYGLTKTKKNQIVV